MKRLSIYHRKMPEINKRIYRIIDFNHENCIKKFAISIGIPTSSIYRLYRKNKKTQKYPLPSIQLLTSIIEKYPDINGNWILTGKGDLFLNTMIQKQCSKTERLFYSYIDSKDLTIKKLTIQVGYLTEMIRILEKKGK